MRYSWIIGRDANMELQAVSKHLWFNVATKEEAGPFEARVAGGFFTAVLRSYLGKSRFGECRKTIKKSCINSHQLSTSPRRWCQGVNQFERKMFVQHVPQQLSGESGCKAKVKNDLSREEEAVDRNTIPHECSQLFMHGAFARNLVSSLQCPLHFFISVFVKFRDF